MERSKQNKHVVCNKDDDVVNCVDNCVDNGNDGAYKHLTYLSQAAECCLTERSKQNKLVVCSKDNDVDNVVDNGDDDIVDNGDNEIIEDGDDGADKLLADLSQSPDCCLMERSMQNKH
eukprot:9473549-Ditylum_brightwellii.AAC.1